MIKVDGGLYSPQVDGPFAPHPRGSREVGFRRRSGKQLRKHLVLDLNLAVTVGGQAIRYTQSKTQPHAVLNPLLPACLSTIHMYEGKLRKREGVANHP